MTTRGPALRDALRDGADIQLGGIKPSSHVASSAYIHQHAINFPHCGEAIDAIARRRTSRAQFNCERIALFVFQGTYELAIVLPFEDVLIEPTVAAHASRIYTRSRH